MSAEKVLWVVNYNNLDWFIERAKFIKATSVAIRTDCDIPKAIPKFHKEGIQVIGWRWPSVFRDPAMKEAKHVVDLFGQGLDGYYVDPEGDKRSWDNWDQKGLEQLAEDFCSTITKAGKNKPFGVTSHYCGKFTFPNLPWKSFFKYSNLLLPQAYWRCPDGNIGHGPNENYAVAIDRWVKTGGDKSFIVPMAGELGSSTAAEINTYAATAAAQKITKLHFYAAEEKTVKDSVWNAMAAA